MTIRLVLGGLKSYLPLPPKGYHGTGGTVTGRYCYTVWLRHMLWISKFVPGFRPRSIVELGPGDSIGLGLAALLSGAREYTGLDVVEHAEVSTNLRVLDELVELFQARSTLPDDREFPRLFPRIPDYAFPAALLNESTLDERLSEDNVRQLRQAIAESARPGGAVQYRCPWTPSSVTAGTADLVVSQVALQDMDFATGHDDLSQNLRAMASWLRPGGVMSHQIDFSCPGGSTWNHHWACSDQVWTLIRGRRPYYVNRVSLSGYKRLFSEAECDIVGTVPVTADGLTRESVTKRFRDLPQEDFTTRAALLIAVKR